MYDGLILLFLILGGGFVAIMVIINRTEPKRSHMKTPASAMTEISRVRRQEERGLADHNAEQQRIRRLVDQQRNNLVESLSRKSSEIAIREIVNWEKQGYREISVRIAEFEEITHKLPDGTYIKLYSWLRVTPQSLAELLKKDAALTGIRITDSDYETISDHGSRGRFVGIRFRWD